jgi:hypothetical protein
VDTGPDTLARYFKHYIHLFVEDGREGESVPTFYISKTMDLDFATNGCEEEGDIIPPSSRREPH